MLTIEEKMFADIPCFEIAVAGEESLAELLLYHRTRRSSAFADSFWRRLAIG